MAIVCLFSENPSLVSVNKLSSSLMLQPLWTSIEEKELGAIGLRAVADFLKRDFFAMRMHISRILF